MSAGTAPVIDSFTFDAKTYSVGSVITATVTFHDPDAKSYTGTATVTDAEGNKVNATVAFAVTDALAAAISDGSPRVYTLTSAPGVSPATFTAFA